MAIRTIRTCDACTATMPENHSSELNLTEGPLTVFFRLDQRSEHPADTDICDECKLKVLRKIVRDHATPRAKSATTAASNV